MKNEIDITNDQWKTYEKKYGNLMWKISHMISGDEAISSPEDNYADLQITAIESVRGFHKKTGASVDEMLVSGNFDKYTKTCLWHLKGSKGAKITRRYPVTKKTLSIGHQRRDDDTSDGGEVWQVSANEASSLESINFFKEVLPSLSSTQKSMVNNIIKDPTLILGSGKVNISKLAECMCVSWEKCKKDLLLLEKKVKSELC